MPGDLPFSPTVIATTGERFSGFAPYAASVNDAGMVAFQATMRAGGQWSLHGQRRGGRGGRRAGPPGRCYEPSRRERRGATSFYGDLPDGGQGVFLLRDGRLRTIADTRGRFALVGPLGPTMNEAGKVAFRADPAAGVSGIFAGMVPPSPPSLTPRAAGAGSTACL